MRTIYITSDEQEFNSMVAAQDHISDMKRKMIEEACAPLRREITVDDYGYFLREASDMSDITKVSHFHIRTEAELKLFYKLCNWYSPRFRDLEILREKPYPQDYFLFDGDIGRCGSVIVTKEELETAGQILLDIAKQCEG